MKKHMIRLIALIGVCLLVSGCSFSRSSKASSKSSSSPSRSSSRSSKATPPAKEQAKQTVNSYQDEVASLTILYVGSGGSSMDFQRELGEISSRHSIADWENNPEAFRAIGIGLKRARVSKDSLQTLPFLQGVSNSAHYREILQGYK